MADLSSKGVVNLVSDEVKQIYGLLEADFTPLELCHRLSPLLESLASVNKEMSGLHHCAVAFKFYHTFQFYSSLISTTHQQLCDHHYCESQDAVHGSGG